jgi:hypothetical protein
MCAPASVLEHTTTTLYQYSCYNLYVPRPDSPTHPAPPLSPADIKVWSEAPISSKAFAKAPAPHQSHRNPTPAGVAGRGAVWGANESMAWSADKVKVGPFHITPDLFSVSALADAESFDKIPLSLDRDDLACGGASGAGGVEGKCVLRRGDELYHADDDDADWSMDVTLPKAFVRTMAEKGWLYLQDG